MAHAYVTFRLRLARHALRQFAASLKSSAEILLLVGTQVIVGLFALSAFPPMYAASQPALEAIALLFAHALAMTIPFALLCKRVLPLDVVHWAHRLPIPASVQLRADALVAGLLVGPLALLYAVSAVILLYQHGSWLSPVRGVLGTLFSLALTYAFSIALLSLRARRRKAPPGRLRARTSEGAAYAARRAPLRVWLLWHRLFWLPFWRADNMVGVQQSALLAAALASAVAWMQAPAGIARGLLSLSTCVLMVVLTDRGDKAVREQTALLRPIIAGWPLSARPLLLLARLFSVAPALLVMLAVFAGGVSQDLWQHGAGRLFLTLGCAAQLLLVATSIRNEGFRVGLVAVEILLLTAVGSELWK